MTPNRRADSGGTVAFFHSFGLPRPHRRLSTFQISASQVRMHSCPHGKCSWSLHKARPIKINWGSLLSHQVRLLGSHVFIYSLPAERRKKGVLCRASASQRNTAPQRWVSRGGRGNKHIWNRVANRPLKNGIVPYWAGKEALCPVLPSKLKIVYCA